MRKTVNHLAVPGAAAVLASGLVSQTPSAAKAGTQSLRSWLGAQGSAAVPLPISQIVSTDLGSVIAGLNIGTDTQVSGVLGQDVLTRHSGVIDVKGKVLYLNLA